MQSKEDGGGDGWNLFKSWCERNGGTPIRGGSGSDHVCWVGPLPDDTIEPGDPGTEDLAVPGSGVSRPFEKERLELALRAANLRLDQARLEHNISSEKINRALKELADKKP